MKKSLSYTNALIISLSALLCCCAKETQPESNGNEIALNPSVNYKVALFKGATLYMPDADNPTAGLRSDMFHVVTFFTKDKPSGSVYFESNAKYSNEALDVTKHRWRFYTSEGSGAYLHYYWPFNSNVDFFAYAPHNCSYVTLDNSSNPPAFTASMPLENTGTGVHLDNMKEFIYAYTPDRGVEGGEVPISFEHPFAAIKFKVLQSHRNLTVKNITISNVYNTGTCRLVSYGQTLYIPEWTNSGKGDMSLIIEKIIPGQVNIGGELGGPYLVLPQENRGVTVDNFSIECHWAGYEAADNIKTFTGLINNDWEAGKMYTYTLDLGNSGNDILLSVDVEPWVYVYNHELDIE